MAVTGLDWAAVPVEGSGQQPGPTQLYGCWAASTDGGTTAHCTLHTIYCTLHTAHCTLHTTHRAIPYHSTTCTPHTAHCYRRQQTGHCQHRHTDISAQHRHTFRAHATLLNTLRHYIQLHIRHIAMRCIGLVTLLYTYFSSGHNKSNVISETGLRSRVKIGNQKQCLFPGPLGVAFVSASA